MPGANKGTVYLKHTQLIITWPDGREQKLSLVDDVFRIGRGESNSLIIPQEYTTISRQHIEIRREEKQYILADLGSGNGVLVNGQRVDQTMLKDNDESRFPELQTPGSAWG